MAGTVRGTQRAHGNHGIQTARGPDGCDPIGKGIIQAQTAASGPGLQQHPGPVDATMSDVRSVTKRPRGPRDSRLPVLSIPAH